MRVNPSMVRAADSDLQKNQYSIAKSSGWNMLLALAQNTVTGSKPGVDSTCRASQEFLYLCTMFIC